MFHGMKRIRGFLLGHPRPIGYADPVMGHGARHMRAQAGWHPCVAVVWWNVQACRGVSEREMLSPT